MRLKSTRKRKKIVVEMMKSVPDEKVHRTLVKAVCGYLVERFGR